MVSSVFSSSGTHVMGILNVTPDSFSDGGEHYTLQEAVDHAYRMVEDGATIIDIGGESTRPGSTRISSVEEQGRILPVLEKLRDIPAFLSIDTLNPDTARVAVEAGADIINDVSGMNLSEQMIDTVASLDVPYILTHARGTSATMNDCASYEDVVDEVFFELRSLRDRLLSGGVASKNIILDPGLGFAKVGMQDWQLCASMTRFRELGHPLLIAGSRKRFLGRLLEVEDCQRAERLGVEPRGRAVDERDAATAALSVIAALNGAWGVRVHDVRSSADALAVVQQVRAYSSEM